MTARPPVPDALEATSRVAGTARVLFVCLGNICRSPTAEVVFRTRAAQAGLGPRVQVASAGTGDWHVGMPPDRRAIAHAQRRGYDLSGVRARKIGAEDFHRYDWILAMDRSNLRDLRALKPADARSHVGLFLDLAPHLGLRDVPDPYYGGTMHFERVLDIVEQASDALLAHLFDDARARATVPRAPGGGASSPQAGPARS